MLLGVTVPICEPLSVVVPPPGAVTMTLSPFLKLAPLMVTGVGVLPVEGLAGLIPEIEGGALTVTAICDWYPFRSSNNLIVALPGRDVFKRKNSTGLRGSNVTSGVAGEAMVGLSESR